jgi:hypothetical protein
MSDLRSPLEIAIEAQDLGRIKTLLETGSCPNDLNHLGIPVFYDALKTNHIALLESLLSAGMNLNIPYNQDGFSAFIYACLYCNVDMVQWLLQQQQDINQATQKGVRGVHVAAQRSDVEMIQLLKQAGADLFCITHHNETPLQISLKSKHGLDIFKWLLRCYQEQETSISDLVLPCLGFIIEKQQPDAVEATQALLAVMDSIPTKETIIEYLNRPGNYSSTPLRSLTSTLATPLSQAIFSLLQADSLARQFTSKFDPVNTSDSEKQSAEPIAPFPGL